MSAATMEISMEVPKKTKTEPYDLLYYYGCISEEEQVSIQWRHMHTHVYCSTIHNRKVMASG
jgi:hypothetical protein